MAPRVVSYRQNTKMAPLLSLLSLLTLLSFLAVTLCPSAALADAPSSLTTCQTTPPDPALAYDCHQPQRFGLLGRL